MISVSPVGAVAIGAYVAVKVAHKVWMFQKAKKLIESIKRIEVDEALDRAIVNELKKSSPKSEPESEEREVPAGFKVKEETA